MASYFNTEYYYASKAKQISNIDKTWSTAEVKTYFEENNINAEEHYKTYGIKEGLNPNAYFNEKEYLAAKLAALQESDSTLAGKSVADLQAEFQRLGINAADHYEQYGAFETRKDGTLLNPSNAFDSSAFFAAKLDQLQKSGFPGADTTTVQQLVEIFKEIGISPVTQFQAYGKDESKTLVQTVPMAQRVANDPARMTNNEIVPGNYNQPSQAPAIATPAPVTKPADVGGLSDTPPALPATLLKVPGDTGFVAPPASVKDVPGVTIFEPAASTGTGPNASWVVVDNSGKATVINIDGKIQGIIESVEKDAHGNYKQPPANAVIKDPNTGENTNTDPKDENGKPVEPAPNPDGGNGDSGNGDGGDPVPPSTPFTVTEGKGADVGKWTVTGSNADSNADSNAVAVTEEGHALVFTSGTSSVKIPLHDIIHLVVNGELTGTPETLAKIYGLTGTGTATLTGDATPATLAQLKTINKALGKVTLNPASKNNLVTFEGTAEDMADAFDGILNGTAGTMTVSGASAATLAELVAINKATTGALILKDASASADYSGNANDVLAAFEKVTTHTTAGTTVTGRALTVAEANALDTATTGCITAAVSGSFADLKTLTNNSSNLYTLISTETEASADDLNAMSSLTTVPVNASAITTIAGVATDVLAVYSGNFTGLGDEDLVVSGGVDTTQADALLNCSTGNVTVQLANNFGDATTLTVQYGDVISIDAGNKTPALKKIAADSSVAISQDGDWFFNSTNGNFTWWNGTDSQTITLTKAGSVSIGEDGDSITICGAETFAVSNYAIGSQNGKVTVSTAGDHFIFTSEDNKTDATVTQASLAGTTNTLTIDPIITLSGEASVLGLIGKFNGDVTVTGTMVAAADLNKIVTASISKIFIGSDVKTITGTATDVHTALVTHAGKLAGEIALNVTLSNAPAQAELKAINAATTGTITLDETGKTVELAGATAADTLATLDGIAGYKGTISVTDAAVSAKQLLDLDALTTGMVTATVTTSKITGSVAELKALIAAKTNSSLTFEAAADLTISDEVRAGIAAADLKAIDAAGGSVTVTNAVHVFGTKADITAALVDSGVTLAANSTATVTTAVTAAEGAALAALTGFKTTFASGVTDTVANLVAAGTPTAQLNALIADHATANIIVSNNTITAQNLRALDTKNNAGKVATSAEGGWTVTALDGVDVAATASVDKFVFKAHDTGVSITNFTSTKDKLNLDAFTADNHFAVRHTTADSTIAVTIAANKVYLVTGGTDAADSAAGSAAAIAAAGVWTNISGNSGTAYFVVVDNNSTSIYKYTESPAAGVTAGELGTAIATIAGCATVADDYLFTTIA